MADVTEVIHRISYEVNKDAFDNATKAIQLQIVELDRLKVQLNHYRRTLDSELRISSMGIDNISRSMSMMATNIEKKIGKTSGLLRQLGNGVLKGLDISDDVESLVTNIVKPLKEELNNLGKTGELSFKNITSSFTSFTGILDIGINLISYVGNKLMQTNEGVADWREELESTKDLVKEMADEASASIGNVTALFEVLSSLNTTYTQKKNAIAELRTEYGTYLQHLSDEELLAGKIGNAYNAIITSIYRRAQAQAYYNKYVRLLGEEEDIRGQIDVLKQRLPKQEHYVEKDGKRYENFTYYDGAKGQEISETFEEIRKLEKEFGQKASERYSYFEKFKQLIAVFYEPGDGIRQSISENETRVIKRNQQESLHPIETFGSKKNEQPVFSQVDVPEVKIPDSKEEDDKRRDKIRNQVRDYAELAQAAADAYNKILQVQIDTLDKEISLREKRVAEAKKLAERGNTEALRLEEERLHKAQQQRENFARRQQAVNAAITVSNAIAAVARAALEGGGFGSVATIAALIAALAAGYAAVTSLSSDSGDSFAGGVIDYKGKGGPKDDKNWVRISSGESIITAEGTKKHRALLEAINNGSQLQLTDTALPFMMPAFRSPGVGIQGQYASANDMQRLETKLDEVVDAIEGNKLKQDIFFNEQGVGIMTECAIQRNRRRWK